MPINREKKLIRRTVPNSQLDLDIDEIMLKDLAVKVEKLIAEYGGDSFIEENEHYSGYNTFDLIHYSLETDDELENRISQEEKREEAIRKAAVEKKKKKEKNERKEYERLKKKFGPK